LVRQYLEEGKTKNAIIEMARRDFGISSASAGSKTAGGGAPNNATILNTINKYLPDGTAKFVRLDDVPYNVAEAALRKQANPPAFDPSKPLEIARKNCAGVRPKNLRSTATRWVFAQR
jgi:hypothetical protein